jgi:hypothetical protein
MIEVLSRLRSEEAPAHHGGAASPEDARLRIVLQPSFSLTALAGAAPSLPRTLRPNWGIKLVTTPDLDRAQARVENLPEAGDRAFDTLAGGLLRVFARLNQVEDAYRGLSRRVAVLEERPAPRPARNGADHRRTTADGRPDTRGSSAASRFAHRQARSAAG